MAMGSSASAPTLPSDAGVASESSSAERPKMRLGSTTPAPGQYAWNTHVYKPKKPLWSLSSPDRINQDPYVATWTPATTAKQAARPAPDEYLEDLLKLPDRNGNAKSLHYSFGRNAARMPPLPKKDELKLATHFHIHETSELPVSRKLPRWSVYGQDRSRLRGDKPTWNNSTDGGYKVPGPGSYEVQKPIGHRAVKPRNQCSFGSRTSLDKMKFMRTR